MTKHRTGVIFKDVDYAGFLKRIIIMAVDLPIIYLFYLVCYYIDDYFYRYHDFESDIVSIYTPTTLAFLYLTVLKASKLGTLGQKVTNTKILTIKGKRPNIFLMAYRLLFWIVGPFNFLFDIGWITLNKEKRTLRDSICNTIVVRKDAEPVTLDAKIRNARALVFGFHFIYETTTPPT